MRANIGMLVLAGVLVAADAGWADPITGDTVTGDLSVEGDTVILDSDGAQTFKFGFDPGGDKISFWHSEVGDWIWDYEDGADARMAMALSGGHALSLYEYSPGNAAKIVLDPGDPGASPAVPPSIKIGGAKVLTEGNFGTLLAGGAIGGDLTVDGDIGLSGTLVDGSADLIRGFGDSTWFPENTMRFGTNSSGNYFITKYLGDGGGYAYESSYLQRWSAVWQWQHQKSGGSATAMHLVSVGDGGYRGPGAYLYLLDPSATGAGHGKWETDNGWSGDYRVLLSAGASLGNYFQYDVGTDGRLRSGDGSAASGDDSVALGNGDAFGKHSVALGVGTASSFGSVAVGYNEDIYTAPPGDPTDGKGSWLADPANNSVFEVGVGSDAQNGENAVTVLKDGTVELGKKTPAGEIPLKVLPDGTVVLSEAQGDIPMY